MEQLREWSGWHRVLARYEESGYGLVSHFSRIASEICGGRFSAEAFQREQCEQGERYLNQAFGERRRLMRGDLRRQLQEALARLSEADRLRKFREPLYALRGAEIRSDAGDGFEITNKKSIRDYTERLGIEIGYGAQKQRMGVQRRISKNFGGWLRGGITVDIGGADRVDPDVVDFAFTLEIDEGGRTMSADIGLGDIAEALSFYQSIVPPRNLRMAPPARDSVAISRMAKHGVKAQLWFFDLLMTDLAESWRG